VRKAGFKTYYLGQSVPFQDVVSVVNTHNPDIIITSLISSPFGTRVQDYLNRLSEAFPDKKVFASGYQIRHFEIKNFKNIQIFHNALNLKDLLALV
jgi:methylmalonyl-CoA mutase cobalamin-binding subunit